MRPKAKFLTAVWGETYVARFAALALPSFLAPGNLPALSAATELEVVILTARRDIGFFERHAAFRTLRELCRVRFVEIDDLIVGGVYGVTLTLAYARAMFLCGREMLDTHFVFMNADFVLADGSLRSLCRHILEGRAVVLAPSFRATAEALEAPLRRAVQASSGVLAMPPRELLGMAMRHPHPTTVAKTLTQGLCHSVHPNQFFWQVDAQTLLGRYFLIFMLCLKPQREVRTVSSFCDYGFIPDLCPSADELVMGDSDEFFMLELQQRSQEMFYLRFGPQTEAAAAASLSEWTTQEHRRAAQHDVVFHSADLPAGLDAAKAHAKTFVDELSRRLAPSRSHIGHPYWVPGLKVYGTLAEKRGLPVRPPELGPPDHSPVGVRGRIQWLATTAHRTVLGHPPYVTAVNPHWLDYRHLADTVAAIPPAARRHVLVVREWPIHVDELLACQTNVRFVTLNDILFDDYAQLESEVPFSHVLVYLQHTEARFLKTVVERCLPLLEAGARCDVFVHRVRGEMESGELLFDSLDYLEASPGRAEIRSAVGSSLKRFNSAVFTTLGRHYGRYGAKALLWIAPGLALLLPLIFLSNLALRSSQPTAAVRESCSSVTISVRRN